jgi:hypothetical protein
MAQRVEYPALPGVREDGFIPTLNKVYGHVRRNQLAPRELREWLKDEGLYHKDEYGALLGFLDLQTEPVATLGPWAAQFFDAPDEDKARDLLFKRLVDENTLLVKYVLEALDTEGGGRLHSTSELHRMLTSYVYPGKHVGLVPFNNWIKWIVASGRVKFIGIRWGLTELGKQVVPRMRTIDADEFLEDEKAGAGAPAPVVVPAAPAPGAAKSESVAAKSESVAAKPGPVLASPEPATKPAAKAKTSDEDMDGEELPDLPPEAEPVDDAVFARYEEQAAEPPVAAKPAAKTAGRKSPAAAAPELATTPAAAVTSAGLSAPVVASGQRHTESPAQLLAHVRLEQACTRKPLEVAEVLAALRAHGRQKGLGGGSLLLAHGLESRMAQTEPARHLFLAALLARLYASQPDGSLANLLVERVGGLGPVAILLDRPESLSEVLVRWNLAAGDLASAQARAALVDATVAGRALKAQADLPALLADAASSEVLLTTLGNGLLRAASATTQFWLVREMVRAGVWTRPSATEIAFVPTRASRLMAYRLRWIDSHFAQGQAMLLVVVRRLAPLLPAGSVEAAAWEDLAPTDHLRFDCAQVPVCQQPCGWHQAEL